MLNASRGMCGRVPPSLGEWKKKYFIGTQAKDWFENELEGPCDRVETGYECVQEAGDIVYIPVAFSHAVVNLSDVMGLVIERHR